PLRLSLRPFAYTTLLTPHSHLPSLLFFFNDTAPTEIYTLSLHDALPIYLRAADEVGEQIDRLRRHLGPAGDVERDQVVVAAEARSEEHTSELQSLTNLVCRLLLEKKKRQRRLCGPAVTRGRRGHVRGG